MYKTMLSQPTLSTDRDLENTPAEQRVVFFNLSWQKYEQILEALSENRAVRLTYDRGTLEITMPLEEHEHTGRLIELFIRILVEELGLEIKTLGSTTLKRSDLDRSPEPDNCYYIQNEPKVRGKLVDLSQDPPPDLVVEVDITHSDIDKPDLYASMGVPELWRYSGDLQIYQLQEQKYAKVSSSPTFPKIGSDNLTAFLRDCQTLGESGATRNFRAWVRRSG
jgi:Uma2 family endonuclease